MFPTEILLTYLVAVLVVVAAPGPDNILAISRGLSQGRAAAALSSLGAGLGIMFHSVAAAFGLALVLQASPVTFWIIKAAGAIYLLWLGFRAIASRSLITFTPTEHQIFARRFATGLFSNVPNPKPGLFVVAFIPQFTSPLRGPVSLQILGYGAIFALVTVIVFTILGAFATRLSTWLSRRPKAVAAANVGAGLTFITAGITAGLSILALEHRR